MIFFFNFEDKTSRMASLLNVFNILTRIRYSEYHLLNRNFHRITSIYLHKHFFSVVHVSIQFIENITSYILLCIIFVKPVSCSLVQDSHFEPIWIKLPVAHRGNISIIFGRIAFKIIRIPSSNEITVVGLNYENNLQSLAIEAHFHHSKYVAWSDSLR